MPGANIRALCEDRDLKFLFVGGKGGVGKTTTSSSIASQLAYDRKVLLISTDPAHSLGDAFRMEFCGEPRMVTGVPNLEVMEVNPETNLQAEIQGWAEMAAKAGMEEMAGKVKEFQEWLSGVPGIDEATALTSTIEHIESGRYDTIVFDTAPTGHTLKLLQLPAVLQAGLDKLQSWQAKMWDAWSMMQGVAAAAAGSAAPEVSPAEMKAAVGAKLQEYKDGMEKIGGILQNNAATNFVVVCIAEFLSVNETRRLLGQLQKDGVACSHVVVNQLVVNSLSEADLPAFDKLLARAEPVPAEDALLARVQASIELCSARGRIQASYLKQLKGSSEVTSGKVQVVEMPLLSTEITGPEAILSFSQLLVGEDYRGAGATATPQTLENWTPTPITFAQDGQVSKKQKQSTGKDNSVGTGTSASADSSESTSHTFALKDKVKITGLENAPHYNDYEGRIVDFPEPTADGKERVCVEIIYKSARKRLALSVDKLVPVVPESATPPTENTSPASTQSSAGGMLSGLLDDPDVQEALKNPKVAAAYEEVQANPMSFMKYLSDPDVAPIIQKIMAKRMGGGAGGNPMAGLMAGLGQPR